MKQILAAFGLFVAISGVSFSASAAPLCKETHLEKENHFQIPEGENVYFFVLETPLVAEIKKTASFRRKKKLGAVPWKGTQKFETLLFQESNIPERFSEHSLYGHSGNDRGPLEVVVRTYLNLQADLGAKKAHTMFSHMTIALQGGLESRSKPIALERLRLVSNLIAKIKEDPALLLKAELDQPVEHVALAETVSFIDSYYAVTEKNSASAKLGKMSVEDILKKYSSAAEEQGIHMHLSIGSGLSKLGMAEHALVRALTRVEKDRNPTLSEREIEDIERAIEVLSLL